jgi:hypothetical protein
MNITYAARQAKPLIDSNFGIYWDKVKVDIVIPIDYQVHSLIYHHTVINDPIIKIKFCS